MEAILSNEDYNEFTNRVNIARERGVDVPHNVEQIGDKYKITLDQVKEAYPDIVWGGRS